MQNKIRNLALIGFSITLLLSSGIAVATFQPEFFERAARVLGFPPRSDLNEPQTETDSSLASARYSIGAGSSLKNLDASTGKRFTRASFSVRGTRSDLPDDYYMSERKFPPQVPGTGLQAYETHRAWGGISSPRRSTSLGSTRRRCGRR